MGIDLKVLASNFRERRGELLATASLRFERDEWLFTRLAPDVEPPLVEPLPPSLKVGHYEDEGLRWDDTDRLGRPLTFTSSDQLRRLRVAEEVSPWNRAVLSFLLSLPPDTKLVLYWC